MNRRVLMSEARERKLIDPFTVATMAHTVRILAGEDIPPYDVERLLENLIPGREIHITGDDLPAGIGADIRDVQGTFTIFYPHGLTPIQRRWTVIHAAAHVLYEPMPYFCARRITLDRVILRREHNADIFAAEMLCPVVALYNEIALVMDDFPTRPRIVTEEDEIAARVYSDEMDRCADVFEVDRSIVESQLIRLKTYLEKTSGNRRNPVKNPR
jgi:hypothetical protein